MPLTLPSWTQQQKIDYNRYGCSARCLVKLAQLHGHNITNDDLAIRHANFFEDDTFGLLADSDLLALVLFTFKLAYNVSSTRRKDTVKRKFIEGASGVFVLTDRPFDGSDDESFHTQLLLGFDQYDRWVIFNPSSDGMDYRCHYTETELEAFLPHFLVLYPTREISDKANAPFCFDDLPELPIHNIDAIVQKRRLDCMNGQKY